MGGRVCFGLKKIDKNNFFILILKSNRRWGDSKMLCFIRQFFFIRYPSLSYNLLNFEFSKYELKIRDQDGFYEVELPPPKAVIPPHFFILEFLSSPADHSNS